jgi:hypothetical protein
MVLSTLEISFLTKTFKGALYLSKFYFHMMFPLSEDIAITDPGFVLTINTLLNPNSSNKVWVLTFYASFSWFIKPSTNFTTYCKFSEYLLIIFIGT